MSQWTSRVVGTGSIGSRYVRLLASRFGSAPQAVPAGGFFRDPELSRVAILEPYGVVDRPTVDLTVIATRTGRHVRDFEVFGEFSRHVLIEKPIAPSYPLGRAVIASDMAASSAVSAPLRFMQGFEAVCALLPRVGRICDVDVVCQSWLPDWRPGTDYRASYSAEPDEGGVLRDLVHEIDYALRLFGAPQSVSAVLGHSQELGILAESSAELSWNYPDFVLTMSLDYVSPVARRHLSIRGDSAVIIWNVLEGTVRMVESGNPVPLMMHFPHDLARDEVLMRQVAAIVSPEGNPRLCTVLEALRAVALCDAARESAFTSTPVVVKGPPWEGV